MRKLLILLGLFLVTGTVLAQAEVRYAYEVLPECTEADWAKFAETDIADYFGEWQEWGESIEGMVPIPDEAIVDSWNLFGDFINTEAPECFEAQKYRYHMGLTLFFGTSAFMFFSEANLDIPVYDDLNTLKYAVENAEYYDDTYRIAARVIQDLYETPERTEETQGAFDYDYEWLPECSDAQLQSLLSDETLSVMDRVDAQSAALQDEGFPLSVEFVATSWGIYDDFIELSLPNCLEAKQYQYHMGVGQYVTNALMMIISEPIFAKSAYFALPMEELIEWVEIYSFDNFWIGNEGVVDVGIPAEQEQESYLDPSYAYANFPICSDTQYDMFFETGIFDNFEAWLDWITLVGESQSPVDDATIADGWLIVETHLAMELPECFEAGMYQYHLGLGLYLLTFAYTIDQDSLLYLPIQEFVSTDFLLETANEYGVRQLTLGLRAVNDEVPPEEYEYPYIRLDACTVDDLDLMHGTRMENVLEDWLSLILSAELSEAEMDVEHVAQAWVILSDFLNIELSSCRELQEYQYQYGLGVYATIIQMTLREDVADLLPGDKVFSRELLGDMSTTYNLAHIGTGLRALSLLAELVADPDA